MQTILVPTDFSVTAKNAAIYALNLARQLQVNKVILYNAYQSPVMMTDATVPVMPVMDFETLREVSATSMTNFTKSVIAEIPEGIEVEQKTEMAILSEDIQEVIKNTGAGLIVIGITGASKMEEVLIGSTATSVIKHSDVPVIVVPAEANNKAVNNIMFACDYKKVAETTPVHHLKKILDLTKAKLHVVNVYEGREEIKSDKIYQQELLQSLLHAYSPEFHFIHNEEFIEGINSFVDKHNIDLIITISRKHGFFEGLFKERHTKKLAFHSHVPSMYVHEENVNVKP